MTLLGGYLITTYKVAGLARRDLVAILHGGVAACRALVDTDQGQRRADVALSTRNEPRAALEPPLDYG